MPPSTLTSRALNRATLARQLLLERVPLGVEDVVGRLVGLQAQVPHDPYTALWSRIDGFDPVALSDGLISRRLVRTIVMRATIHLVTGDDASPSGRSSSRCSTPSSHVTATLRRSFEESSSSRFSRTRAPRSASDR